MRAFLRSRRARRFRPTAYQIYVTVLCGAIGGALGGHAISVLIGGSLGAHTLLVYGPAVLMLATLGALRFGTWQGPVSFSPADVGLLLCAPIGLAALVRPKLDHGLAVGAVAGAITAGALVLVMTGGPESTGAVRSALAVAGFASLGTLAVATSWLVQCSRRASALVRVASPPVVMLAAGLTVTATASSFGRVAGAWSGPWGWVIGPLAGSPGWPVAVISLLVTTAAVTVLARRRAGAATTEQFLARAATRSGLSALVLTLDYRGAALTHRAALPVPAGRLPRIGRPRRPRFAVLWRDAVALIRDRARGAWATLLAAGATYDVLVHPGQLGAAGLGAAALYFAASLLCEPLRIDIDQPDRSALLLPWAFPRVLVAHCVLPTMLLVGVSAVTIIGAVLAGVAGIGALALVPTVLAPVVGVAVLCAALATRRGGRIDEFLISRLMSSDPSNPGGVIMIALWLAPWLIITLVAIGPALVILGGATAHHQPILRAGVAALGLSCTAVAILLATARRSRRPT